MGDRANVYVREDDTTGVYLYTHWDGRDLPVIVRDALRRAGPNQYGQHRYDDGPYLARIVFCQMIGGDTEGTTGYGIGASIGDNEHPIIVLDPRTKTIAFADEGEERTGPYRGTLPMADYAAMGDDEATEHAETFGEG